MSELKVASLFEFEKVLNGKSNKRGRERSVQPFLGVSR
jgi:hypothetical protein